MSSVRPVCLMADCGTVAAGMLSATVFGAMAGAARGVGLNGVAGGEAWADAVPVIRLTAAACAAKRIVAVLPRSPATVGITRTMILCSPPGGMVPSDQVSRPSVSSAWGTVPVRRAPLGIGSSSTTACAALVPVLRILIE